MTNLFVLDRFRGRIVACKGTKDDRAANDFLGQLQAVCVLPHPLNEAVVAL